MPNLAIYEAARSFGFEQRDGTEIQSLWKDDICFSWETYTEDRRGPTSFVFQISGVEEKFGPIGIADLADCIPGILTFGLAQLNEKEEE